jgi:peptidyl-dipeptidase Dcp
VVFAGADAAKAAGTAGKWVYTLQAPSIWPFMQYADNRELRRQIFTAYTTRNDHNDEYDNKTVLARTEGPARRTRAAVGYKTHADFCPRREHGEEPGRVRMRCSKLWTPARAVAMKEAAAQQAIRQAE